MNCTATTKQIEQKAEKSMLLLHKNNKIIFLASESKKLQK